MYYCFDQQSIQRFKAAKTKKKAQIALLFNTPGVILIMTLCSFCGLITYATYARCDPLQVNDIQNANQFFTNYVLNYFYEIPGIIGLFLGAVFCSALSSLSSYLNSLVAIIWEDFLLLFAFFRNFSDATSLTVNKLIALLCGVIVAFLTYIVALSGNNLVQLSASLNSIFNGPLVGLFLLSMFFSVSNKYGAAGGFSAGLCLTAWLSFGAFVVNPVYPKLNVSVAGCSDRWEMLNKTSTVIDANYTISFDHEVSRLDGFNKFYSLSYMLYSTFGCVNTILIGLLISVATGGLRNEVDESLMVFDLTKWAKLRPRRPPKTIEIEAVNKT
jgi:sodium-coupled monocarboxylate transporter 8/12